MNLTLLELTQSSLASSPVFEAQTGTVQQTEAPAGVFAALLQEQESLLQGTSPGESEGVFATLPREPPQALQDTSPEASATGENGAPQGFALALEAAQGPFAVLAADLAPGIEEAMPEIESVTAPSEASESASGEAASIGDTSEAVAVVLMAVPAVGTPSATAPGSSAAVSAGEQNGESSIVSNSGSSVSLFDAAQSSSPVSMPARDASFLSSRSTYRQSTAETVVTAKSLVAAPDMMGADDAVPAVSSRAVYRETPLEAAPASEQSADAGTDLISQARYRIPADSRDPLGLIHRGQGSVTPAAVSVTAAAPASTHIEVQRPRGPIPVVVGAGSTRESFLGGTAEGFEKSLSPGRIVLDGGLLEAAPGAEVATEGDLTVETPALPVDPVQTGFTARLPVAPRGTLGPSEIPPVRPAESTPNAEFGEVNEAETTPVFEPVEKVTLDSFQLDPSAEIEIGHIESGPRVDIHTSNSNVRPIASAPIDLPVAEAPGRIEALTGDDAVEAAPAPSGSLKDAQSALPMAKESTEASAGVAVRLAGAPPQPRPATDAPDVEAHAVVDATAATPEEASPGNHEEDTRRDFAAEPARAAILRARTAYEAHDLAPFHIEDGAVAAAPAVAIAQETVPQGTHLLPGVQAPVGNAETPVAPAQHVHEGRVTIDALPEAAMRSVRSLAGQGDGRITIRLHPDTLGQLDVTVTTANGSIEVEMTSAHQGVREALEGGMPALREALAREGIDVAKVTVVSHGSSLQLSPDGGAAGGRPAAQHGFTPRSSGAETNGFADRGPDGGGRNPSRRPTNHGGTLNMFA